VELAKSLSGEVGSLLAGLAKVPATSLNTLTVDSMVEWEKSLEGEITSLLAGLLSMVSAFCCVCALFFGD